MVEESGDIPRMKLTGRLRPWRGTGQQDKEELGIDLGEPLCLTPSMGKDGFTKKSKSRLKSQLTVSVDSLFTFPDIE